MEKIEKGTNYNSVFGAWPGQTAFYTTIETYLEANGDREKFWKSLRMPIGGRTKTHRPPVRQYDIKPKELKATASVAQPIPETGEGGGVYVNIINYKEVLVPVIQLQNLSNVEAPSLALQIILDYEMERGNEVEYVDHENGKLLGVYLSKTLHFKEMEGNLILPATTEYFECSENIICGPEAGFICTETKQYISAIDDRIEFTVDNFNQP